MEEDPKHHDFDQRHDGPFDQPEPRASIVLPRASVTMPREHTSQSLPDVANPTKSPPAERARKSVQLPRKSHDMDRAARRSTQMSRHRNSRDFDVRRDGPYGRPSLTMSRRQSSGGIPMSNVGSDPAGVVDETAEDDSGRPDVEALQGVTTGFEPEPPALNYSLQKRRWSIILFWTLIIVDCIFMPVGLYFGLHYGTSLTPNIVFSIVTASLGGVSIFEYFIRFWRLYKKGSTCRVIGAHRWYLDWFHWNFSLGWFIIMIELIVGTVPEYPPIRLLAMPVTSMIYAFAAELLIIDTLRYFEIPAPVRISSIPKGAQLRPGIYSIIEDVCAVDGSGGTEFREALNKRYEASHVFRAMLRRLGAFWAFGGMTVAVITTILVFTLPSEAAYVVGWAAPFIWAGIWSLLTWLYVKRMLRLEKTAWTEEIAEKTNA